jgi:hypothetical protein
MSSVQPAGVLPEGAVRAVVGGTVRLTWDRPDGARLEMSLTRGERRTSSVYAFTGFCGRLLTVSARSWGNGQPEPKLGAVMRKALTSKEDDR